MEIKEFIGMILPYLAVGIIYLYAYDFFRREERRKKELDERIRDKILCR